MRDKLLKGLFLLPVLGLAMLWGCGESQAPMDDGRATPEASSHGVILISLDTLRADHVGAYGYPLPTTPQLDRFAARSVVFERAMTQYPSTVLAHMTMLTGLYPAEHAVYPPRGVLPLAIPSVAEGLFEAGVRTANHNEAGYMSAQFGFDRGFGEYSETYHGAERGIAKTLERGVQFLESLSDEPFFLFLHTYSIHDPYAPPPSAREMFVDTPLPAGVEATGEWMREVNLGRLALPEAAVKPLRQLYDAQIRYADEELGRFLARIEELGLLDDTTVILTSDHGEEFAEHGRLAHTQVYPETLFVPLVVFHPRAKARRVAQPVGLIDLAPTIYDVLGVEAPRMSGVSLLPQILRGTGEPGAEPRDEYAETLFADVFTRTLVAERDDTVWQLMVHSPPRELDGHWVATALVSDVWGSEIELRGLSFAEPRSLSFELQGEVLASLELTPEWSDTTVSLGRECAPCRLVIRTDACLVPAEVGAGDDTRCLGFKLDGPLLGRGELYELGSDPLAHQNLLQRESELARELWGRLGEFRHEPWAVPVRSELPPEIEAELRSLGYL